MTNATPSAATSAPPLNLVLDVPAAEAALALPAPEPTDALRAQADAQVAQLLTIDPADDDARTAARAAVDGMGRDLQTRGHPEPHAAGTAEGALARHRGRRRGRQVVVQPADRGREARPVQPRHGCRLV